MHRPVMLIQRPNSQPRSHFGRFLSFRKPKGPNSGQASPSPVPYPALGMVDLEPCQGASGGTKNHPAPNDPKLGQLRRARQGLVRVPESNTKYGANWGKPEGARPLRSAPSISESSEIPKRKKFVSGGRIRGSPRCSQGNYILCPGAVWGLLSEDSRKATEVRAGMPAGRWSWAADNRHGAADSTGNSSHDRFKTDAPRVRAITPAGLMFLAITSVGWGFNWPVTKIPAERSGRR